MKIALNPLSNDQGMSLVEIMVVLVVMSLIGLGTTSLLKNMLVTQSKIGIKGNIQNIKNQMESVLRDDTAFMQTVNLFASPAATNLGCYADGGPDCTDRDLPAGVDSGTPPPDLVSETTVNNFVVRDRGGLVFYDATVATNGFTLDGAPCTTYDNTTGNDDCPIRFNFDYFMECPGALTTCGRPTVTVTAVMKVNPASKGDPRFNINVNNFYVFVRRDQAVRNEPILIRHFQEDNTGPGNCGTSANDRRVRTLRDFTGNGKDLEDPANNVTKTDTTFTLNPGTYNCTVTAQAFDIVSGFQIFMTDSGSNDFFIGSGITAPGNSTVVTGSAHFSLSASTTFEIVQVCADNSTNLNNFNQGIPLGDYTTGNSFTQVFCTRTN